MSDTTHDGGLALSTPPSADDGLSASQLAAKYGLDVSGARPGLFAYIRQLWGRRHFILAFSRAKLTAQYSQAKLGQVWQVVTPLLNAMVYFLIFGLILNTKRGMTQDVFIPFLVTGVFVFTFTQSSVMAGVKSISGNLGLVRALHFPRASLPISFSLQQLQQLLFSMIVLLAVAMGFGSYPALSWLLVIPALAMQFVFNSGLALIMARMGSKTPDLAQLMPFIMRTWMYASGVMFSIPVMLADKPQWIANVLQYNPVAIYMDLIRFALIDGYGSENLPSHVWAVALAWALVVGAVGFVYFWKAEERYGRG
ncbi:MULTISPECIES: ABC transporter permease [unclassified Streptomyces]|uniref:Transport permease protein n=2 Tax=Streptomyces TaxID=1883 RepID=A0ABU2RSJ7_9ACTN|nr:MULTISPECIES: ABC transporter permease [unclassified Streptomyces]MYR65662.1 ABC transporter permease [Streptomyces sp. SID4939]MYS02267.1 ABC transporter permease [Streptomyces sp. SID4940]MYT67594.1 ABC transporter permease [Streptomyces sp. SID8357]MYT86438.1 ABC transporter permease [Streptomyces sp. SID8360]MYU35517.1 ABC transporter permease [Streptomyces sp. SID8358]MYW41155.1 ABC transporter permease [Streptomyces sp. SID1]MYX71188.1 ABC transporter permease [Streptomyces sp. SID3